MVISLHFLNLLNYAESMVFCWSSMMLVFYLLASKFFFLQIFVLIECRSHFSFVKAHGTLVCGENGGGAAELFECEKDIDIGVGTLSKAAGCQGGFITCR
jgi:hypothetical protein